MKRTGRIVFLIAVLGLLLSLCGCGVLDELRTSRAMVTPDGVITLYNGTEYMLLPECQELSPAFTRFEQVYVVEEDIPLLLTVFSDNCLIKSDDGLFLQTFTEDGEFFYYCRSDVYDSVLARINQGFTPDIYCYSYYDYETEENLLYTLTQAQVDALIQVCATQEPEILPEAAMLGDGYMADLFVCTEDKLFRQDTVDVCMIKEKYYVLSGDDATILYSVPSELSPVFAGILEKLVESDSYWENRG